MPHFALPLPTRSDSRLSKKKMPLKKRRRIFNVSFVAIDHDLRLP